MLHEGTCPCGAVRMGLLSSPIMKYLCHCSHCRKFSGQPYQACVAVFRWSINVEGPIEYVKTVGGGGLFSLDRGRCSNCKAPIVEYGGRCALPYAMCAAEPLGIEPDINFYYDSGLKQGPEDLRVTIRTDFGSFMYEIWLILTVAIPSLPMSLWAYAVYKWNAAERTKKRE